MMSTQLTDCHSLLPLAAHGESVCRGVSRRSLLVPALVLKRTRTCALLELHQSIIKLSRRARQPPELVSVLTPQVRQALKASNLDMRKVETAVSFLSDEELAKLAAQSREMQRDLAAGALNNQQITYILIALVTAVIVILAT